MPIHVEHRLSDGETARIAHAERDLRGRAERNRLAVSGFAVALWLIVSLALSGSASAAQGETEMVSPKLAMAGALVALVGVGVVLHPSEDDVHF